MFPHIDYVHWILPRFEATTVDLDGSAEASADRTGGSRSTGCWTG